MRRETAYFALFTVFVLAVLIVRFGLPEMFVEGGLLRSYGLSDYIVPIAVVFYLIAVGAVIVTITVKGRR